MSWALRWSWPKLKRNIVLYTYHIYNICVVYKQYIPCIYTICHVLTTHHSPATAQERPDAHDAILSSHSPPNCGFGGPNRCSLPPSPDATGGGHPQMGRGGSPPPTLTTHPPTAQPPSHPSSQAKSNSQIKIKINHNENQIG